MSAIAGAKGHSRFYDASQKMLRSLAHRGGDELRQVASDGVFMQMSFRKIERFLAPFADRNAAVWDGIPPAEISAQALSRWPSPFVIAAIQDGDLFIARDPLGVKPLYYGQIDGALVFASEVKALLSVTDDVHEFPPGHFYTAQQGFQPFTHIQAGDFLDDDADTIVSELRKRLEQAIQRWLVTDTVGVWLSGGVDSSVIATLLRPRVRKLHSFVIGLPNATDLEYGQIMANLLQTEHHAHIISLDDVLAVLPDVIYALESFDALLVRSSVTHYLISKVASEYVELIFTGEGGDELFAGYDYMKDYPLEQLPVILEQAVRSLHNTAFQRVDRCAGAHGLIPCFPFADMDVVEYALRIPAGYKLYQRSGKRIEKWILRRVVEQDVPEKVLWRPKTKFWRGTGLQQFIGDYADSHVSDRDFERERRLPNGWILASKEELMYYRIFSEFFGKVSNLDWMGRTQIPG
ncbi:asparagine synthase-related protein [Candidatus Caldatribacterium saccharofermentans]|uniref:asparagine synthase-related protein n=1 Tax=Candidatus Caldatribacterium saccharofermentans TaxID=1454753 RepID=UPI003D00C82E